jgi:hypothetical protein
MKGNSSSFTDPSFRAGIELQNCSEVTLTGVTLSNHPNNKDIVKGDKNCRIITCDDQSKAANNVTIPEFGRLLTNL